MKEIYLDNAATTRCYDEVLDIIEKVLTVDYGNPSSLHRKGIDAEKYIKKAKRNIAKKINCSENELYFTSCGTESNNTVIFGTCNGYKRDGKHIITTKIEHASVLESFKNLEEKGYEVTYLDVDEEGFIDLDQLENSITEDTILVSIMHINNEIGTIQKLEEVGNIIKQKNRKTLFHVDAVQSFGKIKIDVEKFKIDALSASGHKIHAPKGIGVLYMKKGLKIKPLLYGGSQQKGFRSGTENVAFIAALDKALEIGYKTNDIKKYFIEKMEKNIENIKILGKNQAKHIVSIAFKNIKAEVLLHSLESEGIYVSSGSACSSNKNTESHVLKAINLDKDYIDGVIRFSFSNFNTKKDIDYTVEKTTKIVNDLRKYMR